MNLNEDTQKKNMYTLNIISSRQKHKYYCNTLQLIPCHFDLHLHNLLSPNGKFNNNIRNKIFPPYEETEESGFHLSPHFY